MLDDGRYRSMEMSGYAAMSDVELVALSQSGDDDATNELFYRYKNYVRSKARTYFLIGADREDIIQEGMIGLYKAIRDFQPDRQYSFTAFCEMCVTRQMITAIKRATRKKHIPLNTYVSFSRPVYEEDSERTLIDTLCAGSAANPEELMISREEYSDIAKHIDLMLSKLERKVLVRYLAGQSYQEISDGIGKSSKSIDNSLQRVKRKLEKYLAERESGDAGRGGR